MLDTLYCAFATHVFIYLQLKNNGLFRRTGGCLARKVINMDRSSQFLLVWICFNLLKHQCGAIDITAPPGIIKKEVGLDVDIKWTLSQTFPDIPVNKFDIYNGDVSSGTLIATYIGGSGCYPSSTFCLPDGNQVGFTLTNITTADASRYSIKVDPDTGPSDEDNNGVLYIYQTPTDVTISGNAPVPEYSTLTLTCSATLQSLPEEFQDPETLEYTWTGVITGSGSPITSDPLDRSHDGQTVTCTANDQGASDSLKMETKVTVIVYYPPTVTNQFPDNGVDIVPLGESYNISVWIEGNPLPSITSQNWSFIDYTGTGYDDLPDNVNTSTQHDTDRCTMVANLYITNTTDCNYGNYTLVTGNAYGNIMPVTFTTLQRGPPYAASAPRQEDVTAVSMTISWIAGYNGGSEQTFYVIYYVEGTSKEHKANVDTYGISAGDVIIYKLKDEATLLPDTVYVLRIRAENAFNGSSKTDGSPTTLRTMALAKFTSNPTIATLNDTAEIQFVISGPLTHIIEENCVSDTNICSGYNITVPTSTRSSLRTQTISKHKTHSLIRPSASQTRTTSSGNGVHANVASVIRSTHQSADRDEIHNFTAVVYLADPEASSFIFTFWLYDGDDLLNSIVMSEPDDSNGIAADNNFGMEDIIGVTVAIIIGAVLVGTMLILWRKGKFRKKRKARENEDRRSDTGVAQAEDIRQLQQKCKQLEILHQNRRASLLQPEAMSGRHHRYTNANDHNTDQETTALACQTGGGTDVAQAEDIRQLQQKCKELENRRASSSQPEAMSGRHHRYTNANYHNTDQETTALAFQTGGGTDGLVIRPDNLVNQVYLQNCTILNIQPTQVRFEDGTSNQSTTETQSAEVQQGTGTQHDEPDTESSWLASACCIL